MKDFILFALIAFGLWMAFSIFAYNRQGKFIKILKKHSGYEKNFLSFLEPIAEKIATFIKLDPMEESRLRKNLDNAHLRISPVMYKSQAIVFAGAAFLIVAVLAPLLHPLLLLVAAVVAVVVYRQQMGIADKLVIKNKESIESEMPNFVMYIKQSLQNTTDIISIFEEYREFTNESLEYELTKALADMKTGSVEGALTRMVQRTNSEMLSQVVRGLLNVLRGDSEPQYFSQLQYEFQKIQKEKLRTVVQKKPAKLKPYSIGMLGLGVAMFFIVMVTQAFVDTGKVF